MIQIHRPAAARAIALLAIATAPALAGCHTVSIKEVLNDAYAPGQVPATHRVGEPIEPDTSPKYVTISGSTQIGSAGGGPTADTATSGMVSSAQMLTSQQQWSTTSVRNQVEAMESRMLVISSAAGIKGAAGQAALSPHVRSFKMSIERIRSLLGVASDLDAAAWADYQLRLDDLLAQAQRSVDSASRAVVAVPYTK